MWESKKLYNDYPSVANGTELTILDDWSKVFQKGAVVSIYTWG